MPQLTLRPAHWVNDDHTLSESRLYFAVAGLPDHCQAWIGRFDDVWKVLLRVRGELGQWYGEFTTADEALRQLDAQYE